MKDLNKIEETMYTAFFRWLKNKDNIELVRRCRLALYSPKNKAEKSFWFRFFEGDTGAWTVRDIENAVQTTNNKKYLQELIELSLENKSLKIYYS